MDKIVIEDLEVFFRVGVPDQERATPQRLLLTIELHADFTRAIATDDLQGTIDYAAISQKIARFGEDRSWRLIETLAADIADWVLSRYGPLSATVSIKKFVLPHARHVAVSVTRERSQMREPRG